MVRDGALPVVAAAVVKQRLRFHLWRRGSKSWLLSHVIVRLTTVGRRKSLIERPVPSLTEKRRGGLTYLA